MDVEDFRERMRQALLQGDSCDDIVSEWFRLSGVSIEDNSSKYRSGETSPGRESSGPAPVETRRERVR